MWNESTADSCMSSHSTLFRQIRLKSTSKNPSPFSISHQNFRSVHFDSKGKRMSGKFERLVREEIPIQSASVAMEGGIPSCVTLFDNFLLCYCTFPPSPHPHLIPSPSLPSLRSPTSINIDKYSSNSLGITN